MTERLIILLAVVAGVSAIAVVVRRASTARVESIQGHDLPESVKRVLGSRDSGILYFYGPHCSTCARQAVVLDTLDGADIPIIRLDATVERELAADLSILTVPSTAVVGGGRVDALNLGFAGREVLLAQLERL